MRDTGERLTRGHLTMIVAHRAMVRDLTMVADSARVLNVRPDSSRIRALYRYSARLIELIEHHHTGEDEVLWPMLRAQGAPEEALSLLQGEHDELHALVEELRALVDAGVAGSVRLGALAEVAGKAREVLAGHTADEERELAGRLGPALGVKQWRTFERSMLRTAPRWSLTFMPIWLASAATDAERRGLPGAAMVRFMRSRVARDRAVALEG